MDTTAKKIIAIDFDGTITEPSPYPITGKIRPKAIEVIKKLQKKYVCCLWTCRTFEDLAEAVQLLEAYGVTFRYINTSPRTSFSKKLYADIYIDDKAFGAVIDWDEIERKLLGDDNYVR